MKDLESLPNEFLKPIIPCLNLLRRSNIRFFDKNMSFCEKHWHLFLMLPCLLAYHTSLTVYMGKVFRGELGLVELAYVVSVYMISTQAIIKAVIVTYKKEEIRSIIIQLGRNWRVTKLTEAQINKKNVLLRKLEVCYADPVGRWCYFAKLISHNGMGYLKAYYWMNIIGSWLYMLSPLFETIFRKYILQQDRELLLPFSCSFPFDPSGSWVKYIAVYMFETYSMFCIVYCYLGNEFLMIILCSLLATEFILLREDLLHSTPGYNDRNNYNKNTNIKIIIQRHQKLTELSNQLDNIFNKIIFMKLISANITICFFAFSSKVSHSVLDMVKNFVGVVALIMYIFNLCYYGELLREASSGMADSAYNSLWYTCDTQYVKMILFIINRSQKVCSLTSAKLNSVSLSMFTTVLSTAWSYFSLASSLYEEST